MFNRESYLQWKSEVGNGNPLLDEWFATQTAEVARSKLFDTDFEEWRRQLFVINPFAKRQECAHKYAWAVPCKAALDELVKYEPIVEIGAGTGYWASLLRKRGCAVSAFDEFPVNLKLNTWHGENKIPWTEVEPGGPERAAGCLTLFLCWPPYDLPMANNCLQQFTGETLIYVGEGSGGCTADGQFFETVENQFELVKDVSLPQWDGIHDFMEVYQRKS